MRFAIVAFLIALSASAQADKVLILREAPQGCEEKGEVSISTGSTFQGMIFSDAWINNNASKKIKKAIKKAGGNVGVISDRREFMMESHFRGLEHIELDAWAWKCEQTDD
ncbi:hypothetical protein MWU49_10385 [Alcanivorax sp. S6407]|uniref:hypothetical protein n=1 Tax=Alcanivorax sp. S6407 TaxID=2926424 RepID=UPI001FF40408|nr:hypothetical protein [Alcanivorax sp. S6407]MCK0154110.1 hypothetical protein [Alcanivorax sp. S6407]